MPFTGFYELTLAGTAGASWNSTSGGSGDTLVLNSVHLNAGDTLKAVLQNKPSYSTSGGVMTIPGGYASKLYYNGTLVLTAAGGGGTITSNLVDEGSGINTVKVYSGDSTTDYSSYSIHWHEGLNQCPGATGCFQNYHKHKDGCSTRCYCSSGNSGVDETRCSVCGHSGGHGSPCNKVSWHCNNSPINATKVICGYEDGQILGVSGTVTKNSGTSSSTSNWSWSSKNADNSGDGIFGVKLVEQSNLYYSSTQTSKPIYNDVTCNLILQNNTVVHFKRK